MKAEHPKNVYLNDVAKTNKQNISCCNLFNALWYKFLDKFVSLDLN